MEVSVADIARARRVSERRVLQLVHAGEFSARRVGGRWLIDERELARRPRLGRPMSPRMAWALIDVLSGVEPLGLGASERSRVRERARGIRAVEDPAPVLASWLRARAHLHLFGGSREAVRELLTDSRFVPSGISDPRAHMAGGEEAEGYARSADLAALRRDYLLVPSSSPNVFLRVVEVLPGLRAPLGAVLADLADHNGPREDAEVRRLLGAA